MTQLSRAPIVACLLAVALLVGCDKKPDESAPPDNMQRGTVERVRSTGIDWLHDHDAALAAARAADKPLLIDFYADWCAPCLVLDESLADPRVTALVNARFVALKIDGTESAEAVRPWMDRYGVEAFPALFFVGPDGEPLSGPRFDDCVPPEALLEAFEQVGSDSSAP